MEAKLQRTCGCTHTHSHANATAKRKKKILFLFTHFSFWVPGKVVVKKWGGRACLRLVWLASFFLRLCFAGLATAPYSAWTRFRLPVKLFGLGWSAFLAGLCSWFFFLHK